MNFEKESLARIPLLSKTNPFASAWGKSGKGLLSRIVLPHCLPPPELKVLIIGSPRVNGLKHRKARKQRQNARKGSPHHFLSSGAAILAG